MAKKFNIAAFYFLAEDGSKMPLGGLMRWGRDVSFLIRDKGYEVTVYQKAAKPFEKEFAQGIRVIGVKCPMWIWGNWNFARWLEQNVDTDDPFLFVSQELALSKKIRRAVAVNHGICWNGDKPWYKKWLNRPLQYRLITRLRGIICVDTNYINWCHAELPNRILWEQKLLYVPNYADLEKFTFVPKPMTEGEYPVILFPRRVGGPCIDRDGRGAGLLLKAFEILEGAGLHTRIIYAGPGRLQEPIREWVKQRGLDDRITVTDVPLDEMPKLYTQADVVVVPALSKTSGHLAYIADINGAAAKHTAKKFGAVKAVTDYKEILNDSKVNVVFIVVGHHLHSRFVIEALNAGKHVFVEKPLAINEQQLQDVTEAARKTAGQLVMVGFNRRFSPHTVKIKQLLSSRSSPLCMNMTINAGRIHPEHWIQDPQRGGHSRFGFLTPLHFLDLIHSY